MAYSIAEDYAPLLTRILQAGGGIALRRAGVWRVDGMHGEVIARPLVGKLMRAKYLTGKRKSGVATLTAIGRRLTRVGKAPPVGTEVTYRLHKDVGRGRVIQSTGTTALVIPHKQSSDGPACLHVLQRPHSSAPWKGYTSSLGHYRNDAAVWSIIEATRGLLPALWLQPYVTEPRTLARLIEVRAKLRSIGLSTYGTTLPEEKVALAVAYSDPIDEHALGRFREVTECERATGDSNVADYMEAVLAHDEATFDAAELSIAKNRVGSWMGWWNDKQRDPRSHRLPPSAEVTEIPLDVLLTEMRATPGSHRAMIVTKAYESILARLAALAAKREADPKGYWADRRAEVAAHRLKRDPSK